MALTLEEMYSKLDESAEHVKRARAGAVGGNTDNALGALVSAMYETNIVVRQILDDYEQVDPEPQVGGS